MQYFKNVELANLYPVSEGAVRKWITSAKEGKLDLQIHESEGTPHIANTNSNIKIIEELVEKGKKYKNGRGKKKVTPKPEFYDIFDKRRIVDIINNIQTFSEIPLAYSYFNGGAEYWDKYVQKLSQEEGINNALTSTISLLDSNTKNIDKIFDKYSQINVIDLGSGNGLPIKQFLANLLEKNKLGRYVAVDSSKNMLDILERNTDEWFRGKVKTEKVIRDFSSEKFDDLLIKENLRDDSEEILNVILVLGGTLANFKNIDDSLRIIRSSISSKDLLIATRKLDTEDSRRFFDFNPEEALQHLSPRHKLVPYLLGIEEGFYKVTQEFDKAKKIRSIKIKLKVDLEIDFKTSVGRRKIELYKNKEILLWRAWHQDYTEIINQYHSNNFSTLLAARTVDEKYILTVCKVNCED